MNGNGNETAEQRRLDETAAGTKRWKRWGPYLADRQWSTVREDYSANGDAWGYFPHDHARSRAYRWGEDGLLGICDERCRLCFSIALWNGLDPILKERLFGLTNAEGNHGEDVKEAYWFLDATPTHSYLKALYRYPLTEFPYAALVLENARRGKADREYELADTGALDGPCADVLVEYAKADDEDILIRITVTNRGDAPAAISILPTIWFRNTWSWGGEVIGADGEKPQLRAIGPRTIRATQPRLGTYLFAVDRAQGAPPPELLFTENETNAERLFGARNASPFVKDAFHRHVVNGERGATNPAREGTKAAAHYTIQLAPGASSVVRARLAAQRLWPRDPFGPEFETHFAERIAEAHLFHDRLMGPKADAEDRAIVRQGNAGLIWSKQFYHYAVRDWLSGDPATPPPPRERTRGRNSDWLHFNAAHVMAMPDKWEYPWFAAWDHAFHAVVFAKIDPHFAKRQLDILTREWTMHPSGQMPAYEFAFGDVNPPVHAWAVWRVYKMTGPRGARDRRFLERVFHKLLLNFTWWVNRKDPGGRNVFGGGFLGLDNIGVFDRNRPLPDGAQLQQSDGTAWMAFYCGTMLSIALELARENPVYEDIASKFFEHFIAIADAMNFLGGSGLWDEEDGFYYDKILLHNHVIPVRLRSAVGIIPLLAAEVLDQETIDRTPGFRGRMEWFLKHSRGIERTSVLLEELRCERTGAVHRLLAIPTRERLVRALRYILDEREFLSPHGVRSLSAAYRDTPYRFRDWDSGAIAEVRYTPGESDSDLFGGNSNWRGPIWFPINFLLVESLERYHHFYNDTLKVECPTGSGHMRTLAEVSRFLAERLVSIFRSGPDGLRPFDGGDPRHAQERLLLFHEYFDGDTGRGLGASHQTGWTALVTTLLRGLRS